MHSTQETLLETQDTMEQARGYVSHYNGNIVTLPYVHVPDKRKTAYLFVKRAADVLFSLLGLIVLSPVFLLVALAIRLDSKGSVFYVHPRVGQNGSLLRLYKFRTMTPNADKLIQTFSQQQKAEFEENYKLSNDPRLTRIGGFLRESSLDELPQLLNILQGNLSFVGPRPLVEEELKKYGSHRFRFLRVKPGLTGNWQVSGRNNTTYQQRMALELYYVDNASLWLDAKILFKTVPAVLRKVGAK